MMDNTHWEFIHGFGEQYMISSSGQVLQMNVMPPNLVEQQIKDGRIMVTLFFKGKKSVIDIARLVAEYYLPNPTHAKQVRFKDGNPKNCHVNNLEWENSGFQEESVANAFFKTLLSIPDEDSSEEVETSKSLDSEQDEADNEDKVNNRPVWQYTKSGKFIKEWQKPTDILHAYSHLSYTALYACLREEHYTCGGYRWKYAEEGKAPGELEAIQRKNPWTNRKDLTTSHEDLQKRLPILCYKKDGSFLAEYSSEGEAEEATGVNHEMIRRCCLGKAKSTSGFRFMFKESDDYPKKLSPLNLGVPNEMRGMKRPVLQFTEDGRFIKEWDSVGEAEKTLHSYGIGQCCLGKKKLIGGYVWFYKGDELPLDLQHELDLHKIQNTKPEVHLPVVPNASKSVCCYDMDGNYIRRYDTASEAAKDMKIGLKTLVRCCEGKETNAGNYVWAFEDAEDDDIDAAFKRYILPPPKRKRGKTKQKDLMSINEFVATMEEGIASMMPEFEKT